MMMIIIRYCAFLSPLLFSSLLFSSLLCCAGLTLLCFLPAAAAAADCYSFLTVLSLLFSSLLFSTVLCYAGLTLLLCFLCSLPVHWRNGGGGCFILLVGYLQIKEGNFAFGALCAFRLVLEMRVALQKSAMQRKFLYMPVSAVKLSNTAAF